MPTGYTSKIGDDQSFKDFALRCARNFGANILMRDDPMDAEIKKYEVEPYYMNRLTETIAEKSRFLNLSKEEMINLWNDEFNSKYSNYCKCCIEKVVLKSKYEKMLAKVKKFIPPTPDHINYKNFMIEQIQTSIDFDCSTDYMIEPKKESFLIWKTRKIKHLNDNINYYIKKYGEEVVRTDGRNNWNEKLFEALKGIE